ncbi:MAG: EamA family transporter [Mogibacterium sp.]|nr:EamA family transporter [Mogibacterium sp.]
MDDNRKGALLIILAGTCWGVISIFINYLSDAGLGEMQISFLRQLFAVLVFALIMLVRDRAKFRIPLKDLGLLMLVGLVNGVMFNFLYFYTIVHSRASIAVVLLYTSPVFVMILARVFFKEKITGLKFIALVLTVIGCVLVTGVIGEGYTPPPAAILTGVLTGLAYALNNILTSAAVKKNDPLTVTFYTLFFSFLFLIPFSGWNSLTSLCGANPMILLVAFLMCIVTAVLAQYFFSVGLGLIESGKAAIYGATEPIVGSLVGILIFHEESNFMKIAGIIMVIAAILLIGKNDAEKEEDTI